MTLLSFLKCVILFSTGNYRTQLYDKQKEEYLPATQGLGMFVEVKDPDEKVCLMKDLRIIKAQFVWFLSCSFAYLFWVSGDPVPPVWI